MLASAQQTLAVTGLQSLLQQAATQLPEAALRLLQNHTDEYLDDPSFNYALGTYASASGNYGQAINAFERVVLLDPDHAGAWIDLAIAYQLAGDSPTALELLAYIRANFNPPEGLRLVLDGFSHQWQLPPQRLIRVRLDIGHSTNPAAAAESSTIPLYLGEWATFELAEGQRPKPSAYASVGADLLQRLKGHELQLGATLRNYPDNSAGNQRQLLIFWQPPEDPWGRWQFAYSSLDIEPAAGHKTLSLLRLQPFMSGLHWGAGLRLRRHEDTVFNANIPLVLLSYTRPLRAGKFDAGIWFEREQSTGSRPGGSGRRATFALSWQRPVGEGSLNLSGRLSHYRDDEIFSPILPLTRNQSWRQLGVQWDWRWTPKTELQFRLTRDWQTANHSLFEWRETQLGAGIICRF